MIINAKEWVKEAIRRHSQEVTPWFDGATHPSRVGYYDRCFTDGTIRHYWNGSVWMESSLTLARPHWRQVGAYPCWRGLVKDQEK